MRLADDITQDEALEEKTGLVGHMHLELRGPDGELKEVRDVDNLIVTTGSDSIMDQLLASPTQVKPGWMAVGTGGTAVAAGQTALVTELDRNALTTEDPLGQRYHDGRGLGRRRRDELRARRGGHHVRRFGCAGRHDSDVLARHVHGDRQASRRHAPDHLDVDRYT